MCLLTSEIYNKLAEGGRRGGMRERNTAQNACGYPSHLTKAPLLGASSEEDWLVDDGQVFLACFPSLCDKLHAVYCLSFNSFGPTQTYRYRCCKRTPRHHLLPPFFLFPPESLFKPFGNAIYASLPSSQPPIHCRHWNLRSNAIVPRSILGFKYEVIPSTSSPIVPPFLRRQTF